MGSYEFVSFLVISLGVTIIQTQRALTRERAQRSVNGTNRGCKLCS